MTAKGVADSEWVGYTAGLAVRLMDPVRSEGAPVPKMKRHKGLAKRVRLSARGKVRYNKSGAGHLLSGKSGARLRRLRKMDSIASKKIAAKIRRAILA